MSKEKVLIVGGGFAGLKAALLLSKDERFDITLLSNELDFRYYPTLYHVATGGRRANASIPLRSFFIQNNNVKLKQGEAISLDRKAKTITTQDDQIYEYDTLVLALGVVTNYFNIPGLKELAFGVKSIEDIEKLKNHLHQQLIDDHKPDLNYVIVGAGPTGIELAGALPDYLKHLMKLHGIENRAIHIDLIEAGPRLLPRLPKDTAKAIKQRLQKKGIKIYLGQVVQGETANELTVSGKPIQSHSVIWTAGTANNPFFSQNGFVMSANHKVATDIFLQAEENIFVLGDNANTPYSGMAQTAVNDGEFLANNLIRRKDNKIMKSYVAKQPITVIPVGENWAAVVKGQIRIYGFLGWLLRQSADAIAFHDYQPWIQAGRQWLTYYGNEETCSVCLQSIGTLKTR